MKPFIQMTDEEFMKGLFNEMNYLSPEQLLNFPFIGEILTEQLHDAVVSQWETNEELPFANIEESTI